MSLLHVRYLDFELLQFSLPSTQEQLQLLPPPYTGTLIGGLYALILSLPLKDVDRFWSAYSHKFVVHYPLNYLASPEEAAQLTAAYPNEIPPEYAAGRLNAQGQMEKYAAAAHSMQQQLVKQLA